MHITYITPITLSTRSSCKWLISFSPTCLTALSLYHSITLSNCLTAHGLYHPYQSLIHVYLHLGYISLSTMWLTVHSLYCSLTLSTVLLHIDYIIQSLSYCTSLVSSQSLSSMSYRTKLISSQSLYQPCLTALSLYHILLLLIFQTMHLSAFIYIPVTFTIHTSYCTKTTGFHHFSNLYIILYTPCIIILIPSSYCTYLV